MKEFDVFLSHNSKDKPWVKKLKGSLEVYGLKVWLDQDEIRPGDLFAKALERGIAESRAVAVIISPQSMISNWVEAEYYRALTLATNNQTQLIPVMYKLAEIPGFLTDRSWVDFRNEAEYSQSVENLVWGITGEKPRKLSEQNASGKPSVRISGKENELLNTLQDIEREFSTNETYFQDQCDTLLEQVISLRREVDSYSSTLPPLYTSQISVRHILTELDRLQDLIGKFRNTCPPGSIDIRRSIVRTLEIIKNDFIT